MFTEVYGKFDVKLLNLIFFFQLAVFDIIVKYNVYFCRNFIANIFNEEIHILCFTIYMFVTVCNKEYLTNELPALSRYFFYLKNLINIHSHIWENIWKYIWKYI